jgi:hypothetical protein
MDHEHAKLKKEEGLESWRAGGFYIDKKPCIVKNCLGGVKSHSLRIESSLEATLKLNSSI